MYKLETAFQSFVKLTERTEIPFALIEIKTVTFLIKNAFTRLNKSSYTYMSHDPRHASLEANL